MRGHELVKVMSAAALALLVPQVGSAQYVSAGSAPMYGSTSIYGMSPSTLSGVAGGSTSYSAVDSSCRGYGGVAPSHTVVTSGGSFRITGSSSGDTTLMVLGPDGRRYCDDDGGGYPNPQVDLTVPAGTITIWVGSYSSSGSHPYTLTVAPQGGGYGGYGGYAGAGGAMYGTTSFPSGYDPAMLSGVFGGPVDGSSIGCSVGHYSAAPSHIITVTTYVPNLRFVVRGDADTTLAVQFPDGSMACNDDGGGYPHPLVEHATGPGTIRVWVGSYGSGTTGSYVLGLTTNPGITASTLGTGSSPPVVVVPPSPPVVVVPPSPPVVVVPPAGAVRVDLTTRIPVTLFGSGVAPTVAVWSPRGGPDIEVSAMPSGSVVNVSVNVGGAASSVVEVPSAIASGSTVTVTELRNRRLVVRAESSTVGSAMVWLMNYAGGSVEIANTWTGSIADRAPSWAR